MEEFYVRDRYEQFIHWTEFPLSKRLMDLLLRATVMWWMDAPEYEQDWELFEEERIQERACMLPTDDELVKLPPWRAIRLCGKETANALYASIRISEQPGKQQARPAPAPLSRVRKFFAKGTHEKCIHWSEFPLSEEVMTLALGARVMVWYDPYDLYPEPEDIDMAVQEARASAFPSADELARIPSWRMIQRLGKTRAYVECGTPKKGHGKERRGDAA